MSEIKKIYDKKLEIKYNVIISTEEMNKEVEAEALRQQKNIRIDGFRKGKVPLNVIINRYSANLLAETAQSLTNKYVENIIKENNYKLMTRPEINIKSLDQNKDFEFEVTFNVFPKIPEIKYEKIKLKKKNIKLDNKEIDNERERLIKSRSTWKEQDDNYLAKNGDKVKIDFVGKINDVPFDGGTSSNYELELGSKTFIDNFEDQLLNTKKNDNVSVKVTFPKDYNNEELANQPAVFDVTVKSVLKAEQSELTEEFLQKNFNVKTIDELNKNISENLTESYERQTWDRLKNDLFVWLRKNVDVELPEHLIELQVEKDLENYKKHSKKELTEKELEKQKNVFRERVSNGIKLGLITSEISNNNNIVVQDVEIQEELRKRAKGFPGQESLIVDFYLKNKTILDQLTNMLLEDKIVKFILDKANIENVEMSLEKFNSEIVD